MLTEEDRRFTENLCRNEPDRLLSVQAAYADLRADGMSTQEIQRMISNFDIQSAIHGHEIKAEAYLSEFTSGQEEGETSVSIESGLQTKSYDSYLTSLLYKIKSNANIPNDDKAVKRAGALLLIQTNLADRVKLDDLMAMASGNSVPDIALRIVLNKAISDTLGVRYDHVENAWKAQHDEIKLSGIREIGVYLPPSDASYYCMQKAFAMERARHNLRQSDLGGILGLSQSTISRAEGNLDSQWPTYFQSRKVVRAYAGKNEASLKQLERITQEVFYPNGIKTLSELVKSVAYKFNDSIEELGNKINIENLAAKINPNRENVLSVRDKVALRTYIKSKIKSMEHIGVTQNLLDTLLPDPLHIDSQQPFETALSQWAEMASGTKAEFSSEVGKYKERTFATNATHGFGKGVGLSGNLDGIIHVLENNPNTIGLFPAYKEAFVALAHQTIPKHSEPRRKDSKPILPSSYLSDRLLKTPTLGRALNFLETQHHRITPEGVIEVFTTKFNAPYSKNDYENWKSGKLPADVDFPDQLVEAVTDCISAKNRTTITETAQKHLRNLATGKTDELIHYSQINPQVNTTHSR